ncbi:MAG: CHAT domain-containing protein [Saprospiraceae bacterium]
MKTLPFPACIPAFVVGLFGCLWAVCLLLVPVAAGAQVADTSASRLQVDSLVALSRKLSSQKTFDEAIRVIETAEQTALNAFGKQSAPYAKTLFNHGRALQMMDRLDEAEPFYLQAKIIWKDLGHNDYTSALNNLGVLYNQLQRFDEAEQVFLEQATIRKAGNHPDYSTSLYNLGGVYRKTGRYEAAVRNFSEAAAIRAIKPGKKSVVYANALNGLASTLQSAGRYEAAEPIYQEALAIFKDSFGSRSPLYAANLGNFGQLWAKMGRYELAEPIMLEVISILGEDAPEYANNALNLAGVYYKTGRYAEAEMLFVKAKDSRAKHLGKSHIDYAQSLDNLASLYTTSRRYAEAETFYREALVIREDNLGKNHPDYAVNISNLAMLYLRQRRYTEAEPLFLKAQAIKENTLGTKTESTGVGLYSLGQFYWAWDNPGKAANYYLAANAAYHTLIEETARTAGEDGMLAYLTKYEPFFCDFYAFSVVQPTPDFTTAAYDNTLLLKDFLLEKNRRLIQAVQEADTATQVIFEKWQACRRNLSAAYSLGNRNPQMEQEAEGHEKTLTRSLAAFTEVGRAPRWQQVRDALQPTEVAIEFVQYSYFDRPGDTVVHTRYAALLLLPGTAAPHFIPLCDERQIEALLPAGKAIEELSKSETRADLIENLYSPFNTGGKPSLHALLWAPIEKAMAGHVTKTVYFAPAGILHRLNLGALWWNKSAKTLADQYRLVQLGSTRELIAPDRNAKRPKPVSAVIYGGIHYDMDSTAIARANRNMDATAQDTTGGLFRFSPHNNPPTDQLDKTRGDGFGPLPGSEREARHLFDLMRQLAIPATMRLGFSATEESFKQVGTKGPSPALIHIGTHGFFFPDAQTSARFETSLTLNEPAFKISEHPLIRSGLLLAGANYAWENKRPMSGMEDGILTAHEVSQMNLSNTDLVVLSACETGLGDIKGNEGVYGLQRAFRIAGAKNVLMSLWQVSDTATALLLNRFYENWLQKDMTVRAALEEAQHWMRTEQGQSNPYFWAGLVLVGE